MHVSHPLPQPDACALLAGVPFADKATRIIAEVVIEALPQCIMQAVVFVLVSSHVRNGSASPVDMALYTAKGGAFVSLMPKSILISSLTMLKTWLELVTDVSARSRYGVASPRASSRALPEPPPSLTMTRRMTWRELMADCARSGVPQRRLLLLQRIIRPDPNTTTPQPILTLPPLPPRPRT